MTAAEVRKERELGLVFIFSSCSSHLLKLTLSSLLNTSCSSVQVYAAAANL